MEAKFTSGEWSQSHRQDSEGMYSTQVYDGRGKTICTLGWHTEPDSTATDRQENARLIAAAPDMYEALLAMSKGEGLQPGVTIERILLKARGEL